MKDVLMKSDYLRKSLAFTTSPLLPTGNMSVLGHASGMRIVKRKIPPE